MLMVRAVNAETGVPLSHVAAVCSEGFVVATPRVRTAAKKEIPHVRDSVSKLNQVGKATQSKLAELKAAIEESGLPAVASPPYESVMHVGEFRQLVTWVEKSAKRLDGMKKILKLTRGWEEARDHANMVWICTFVLLLLYFSLVVWFLVL